MNWVGRLAIRTVGRANLPFVRDIYVSCTDRTKLI